jgi:hypothetical protein
LTAITPGNEAQEAPMTDSTLVAFRAIADQLIGAADWQWVGPHMSQRMFGITQERAEAYAKRHGGTAQPMSRVAQ